MGWVNPSRALRLYVLGNTSATCQAQLMKKLSNTEAELNKNVAYKKACIS